MNLRIYTIVYTLLLLTSVNGYSQSSLDEYRLIGNNIGVNEMSFSDVVKVFKGQRSFWKNGISITIVLPSTKNDWVEDIANNIYRTSKVGMQKYWLSLVFQGRSNPPFFLDDEEEIIRLVQRTSGAIAFIPAAKIESVDKKMIITVK